MLGLFFHLIHDLVLFNCSWSNIVDMFVFGRYQFISSGYSEHSALVETVSHASPVFLFCLLFREIVSVNNQRFFVSLRFFPHNLIHNS